MEITFATISSKILETTLPISTTPLFTKNIKKARFFSSHGWRLTTGEVVNSSLLRKNIARAVPNKCKAPEVDVLFFYYQWGNIDILQKNLQTSAQLKKVFVIKQGPAFPVTGEPIIYLLDDINNIGY